MKKALTITFLIFSALLILDSMNAGQAFVMLYLAGQIPGTNIYLSAGTMLEGFALLIGFVLSRISNQLALTFFDYVKSQRETQRARLQQI